MWSRHRRSFELFLFFFFRCPFVEVPCELSQYVKGGAETLQTIGRWSERIRLFCRLHTFWLFFVCSLQLIVINNWHENRSNIRLCFQTCWLEFHPQNCPILSETPSSTLPVVFQMSSFELIFNLLTINHSVDIMLVVAKFSCNPPNFSLVCSGLKFGLRHFFK